MLCDVCQTKEANVFFTQIVSGQVQKVNLCEECSKQKGVTDPTGFSGFLLSRDPIVSDEFYQELLDRASVYGVKNRTTPTRQPAATCGMKGSSGVSRSEARGPRSRLCRHRR